MALLIIAFVALVLVMLALKLKNYRAQKYIETRDRAYQENLRKYQEFDTERERAHKEYEDELSRKIERLSVK